MVMTRHEVLKLVEPRKFDEGTLQWFGKSLSAIEGLAQMLADPDFSKNHRRHMYNLTKNLAIK